MLVPEGWYLVVSGCSYMSCFFFRLQEKLFVVIITFNPYCIDGDLHVPPSSLVTIVLSRPLLTRESLALN